MKTPARILRLALDRTGWSQHELATRSGLTDKHLSLLLAGLVPLRVETAVRLEFCLGLAPVREAMEAQLQADLRGARREARRKRASLR